VLHIDTALAQQHTKFYCLSTVTGSQETTVMTVGANVKQQDHI